MCGICGIWHQNSNPLSIQKPILKKMTKRLRHRGPDSDGFHIKKQIGLGFRRLAIIDLNTGDQPIYNEDKSIVTIFNGEIYNYQNLRTELTSAGHLFTTNTDTEVLVHGYEEWGADLPQHLRGMFAFAIWDNNQKRLLLARDRMGQKPLYYARYKETFVFASEIKALLEHPLAYRALNTVAIPEYLSLGYVSPPRTLFQGIYKLPPATTLLLETDGAERHLKYWEPITQPNKTVSEKAYAEQIRHQLEQAVDMRLMSDVPLGTFLSGGIDSTLITKLVGNGVSSFTVGFDYEKQSTGDHKFNVDLHHARQAAKTLNTQHHEIILKHDDLLTQLLPQIVYALDEPIAESASIQTLFVTALARANGIPVLLSGDGSDEIFGGYPFFEAATRVQTYTEQIPTTLRENFLNPMLKRLPSNRFSMLQKLAEKSELDSRAAHFLTWDANFNAQQIHHIINNKKLAEEGTDILLDKLNELLQPIESHHIADWVGYAKLRWWLSEDSNMRYDKMAMWMSVESRAPFEDHELVELALQIPLQYKLPNKAILKHAIQDLLPQHVLNRPKWGFNPPMSDWLRGPLYPLVETYLSKERLEANGLNSSAIHQILTDHITRKGYYMNELWNLLMLQLWIAIYIDESLVVTEHWSADDLVNKVTHS